MPGSGKSTVGVILAKILAMKFVDTDILIQNREKKTLQEIVDNEGHIKLREIEEDVLLDVNLENHVIATGGSAPYSEPAMNHLQRQGIIIFLNASLDTLRERIHNYENRGLAKRKNQSFQDLFEERFSLYTRYNDVTIENNNKTQEEVCYEIITILKDQFSESFSRP